MNFNNLRIGGHGGPPLRVHTLKLPKALFNGLDRHCGAPFVRNKNGETTASLALVELMRMLVAYRRISWRPIRVVRSAPAPRNLPGLTTLLKFVT